ncbi:MAG: cobyrinate a,c-diamide synthase, partial [Waterburya sp.]
MALIIAGDRSGVGKTTITLAILAYLQEQNKKVQSFKVGPDYIDPMFHRAVTDIPCRNLDPFLTSPSYVQACFQRHTHQADCVVIEGVMGLFDGIRHLESNEALNDYGSTAHIARLLNIPVALVLDCSRLSCSIAAIAYGYQNLDPRVKIAGVILNKVASDRHLELLETALNSINMPILGVIKRDEAITIRDRHLGLIPSAELPEIQQIFSQLAHVAKTSLNWNKLLPLTNNSTSPIPYLSSPIPYPPIKIAIAQDKAFNFYY